MIQYPFYSLTLLILEERLSFWFWITKLGRDVTLAVDRIDDVRTYVRTDENRYTDSIQTYYERFSVRNETEN